MRLKSIEMQGFKSFADKIYLDFNSGITAIVGPNGSGKSNISDAIRWVMGEQSIKSLRGSKMEDVIFAGTETRKALGFAEVTLTLDNSDGYFPLDFPEVMVTRRVYRSGDGEYYINKTLCRLKDIHELFMDTGLGRDGYSIIGQGKIDSILSTKSEDRRQIFEEAAGISKYKYRKTEAERKLAQTVENLTRVQDILSELEGQIEPLSRQSEKAKKYLVLRDELRGLDINVSIINIDRIKTELAKLSGDLEILNAHIAEISERLSESDSAVAKLYDEMRKCDEEIEAQSEEERGIAHKISEAEKNVGIFKNDIEHNIRNIERLEIEITGVLEGVELADKELAGHKARLAELNAESVKNSAEIDEVTALAEKTGADADEKSGALESLRSQIIDITSELNSLRGAVDNFKILSGSFAKRRDDITAELDGKTKDRDEMKARAEQAEKNEVRLGSEVTVAENEIKTYEDKLTVKKAESVKLADSRNRNLIELGQKRSRRTMLMDMEREFEGYAKGVKSVMTAYTSGKLGDAEIYGPLAQLIRTDRQYITAIETALGAAGQNIVTKSENEAKRAIAYLKERHLGRATFLPVSAIKGRSFDSGAAKREKGYIAVASELVGCDDRYKNIVSSFLGTTVVCDNIDNAVDMARHSGHRFRIVTLGGDVIQAGGAMTGGSAVKTTGSLSRTGEIDSLAKEIEELKAAAEKEERRFNELQKEIEECDTAVSERTRYLNGLRSEYARAEADKQRYSALLENIDNSGLQLKRELEEVEARITEIAAQSEEKERQIEEKLRLRGTIEQGAEKAQAEYGELSGENEKIALRLTELNIRRSTILKDIELENERIGGLTDSKGGQMESVNVKRGGIETLKNRNASIEKEITDLEEECKALKEKSAECRKNTDALGEKRRGCESEVRERQNAVKEIQEQKFALSQQAAKAEAKCDNLSSERENIINRMWEDYELTYSDALELKAEDGFDFKAASQRIRELKESIKHLGNINIDSIEEYKNVKERFDFLTAQTQDLEKAKKELDSVIDEMMTIMQSRFAEQFKVINDGFNRVFGELFGGGRANLYLTEPDNVLESGIEIEAQPPGKKLQSLTLLSGGERAFTAIALLFAILDVRPTPFCILDEIEAALDDVNVYRYADYLQKYSTKTQFIVVTHRRGTMEAANILYGVTMQERGISKLLSLNIDEIKDL